MWTKFIVHLWEGVGTVWNRNSIDTSFPLPRVRKRHTVTVTGVVSSRESWVMGQAGHGSIDWWVTWVMDHKTWSIVSSDPVITLRASEAAAQCIVIVPVCLFVCLFVGLLPR